MHVLHTFRSSALLWLAMGSMGVACAEEAKGQAVTVRDAVERTRIVGGPQLSPDGKTVAVVVARAEVRANRDTYSLLLLEAEAEKPGTPSPVVDVAREYNGPDVGREDEEAISGVVFVRGGRAVAFLARHPGRLRQVYEVDLAARAVRQRTDHPTSVQAFSLSDDGDSLVYSAAEPGDSERRRRHGFSILEDKGPMRAENVARAAAEPRESDDGDEGLDRGVVRLFVVTRASPEPKPLPVWDRLGPGAPYGDLQPGGEAVNDRGAYLRLMREAQHFALSPDGRWVAYWPHVPEAGKVPLSNYEFYKRTKFADQLDALISPSVLRGGMPYALLDLTNGVARELPTGPHDFAAPGARTRAVWSPDSRSLIVNAFLPLTADDPAENTRRAGLPPQLVEVDVASGTVRPLGTRAGRTAIRWTHDGKGLVLREVENGPLLRLDRAGTEWSPAEAMPLVDLLNPLRPISSDGRRVAGVSESRNSSPEVAVWDADGKTLRQLTDLNPVFRSRTFAPVERITWKNAQDAEVIGYVVKPLGYASGRTYPLVILLKDAFAASNLVGAEDDEFLVDGGDQPSGFAIQTLAANGFVVLHLPFAPSFRQTIDGPQEESCVTLHVGSAIEELDRRGLIDRGRVGVAGFSRAGYHANLLVMSKIPFKAGVLIDGGGSSYLESREWKEDELKGIAAPVLIEAHGYPELQAFAPMFDGLEKLGRPVDLLVFPDGGHNLHAPAHRVTSLQANVDWFRFWLKDEIDQDPSRADQYARWRALRDRLPPR